MDLWRSVSSWGILQVEVMGAILHNVNCLKDTYRSNLDKGLFGNKRFVQERVCGAKGWMIVCETNMIIDK